MILVRCDRKENRGSCWREAKKLLGPFFERDHSCKASLEEEIRLELARGIEPPTGGLQNRCSAIELRQLDRIHPRS